MHTAGSALVAGVNVTVTTSGNTCAWTTYCPTVTQPFFIGYNPSFGSGPGQFTFNFSPAIGGIRLNFSGASSSGASVEEIRLHINGSHYAMTAPGTASGCDPMAILTGAGDLQGCSGCGVSGWSGTTITGFPISTLMVEDFVLGGTPNGSLFSLWICPAILPVEWLGFEAAVNPEQSVDLGWATATEINADYFTVERARDGEDWQALDRVSAVGNSDHESRYHYRDQRPLVGTSHYRLRQTSDDGTHNYSEVRTVTVTPPGRLHLYPNPTQDQARLDFPTVVTHADVQVYDAVGKRVAVATTVASDHAELHTQGLAPGVYSVIARLDGKPYHTQLVVR